MKKRTQTPDPHFEVRLLNRRGREIAKALESEFLPIQSDKGQPKREFMDSFQGKYWVHIADMTRLTQSQIRRLAVSLSKKYDDMAVGSVPIEWCDPDGMERVLKAYGFTVPVEDCQIITEPAPAVQTSFLDRSQPRDYEP